MLTEPIIILANGSFPKHKIPLNLLTNADTIICCDGSINNLYKKNIKPSYIIGDLDSINNDMIDKYKKIIIKANDQNENDLRKTITWVEKHGIKKAYILGATGKREDHTIGNIFSLLQYPNNLELLLYTNHGFFTVINNKKKFNSYIGQQVSIFSTDPSIKITTSNLKYNFINDNISSIYSGTLNESIQDVFFVEISHGKLLIYQTYL